jgi:C1A family cysteine protease
MKSSNFLNLKSLIARAIFIFVILFAISLFSHQDFTDPDNPPLAQAPMNPKFLKYLEDEEKGVFRATHTSDGHPLGLIPDPVDFSYLYTIDTNFDTYPDTDIQSHLIATVLPKSYDLRTKNKLPPVRNQGSCGSCWAFAALSTLESSLLPSQKYDFSEQHLITKHGFRGGPCGGGNIIQALAYLARWSGPLNESDLPYEYASLTNAIEVQKHVQNVVFMFPRSGPSDNRKIKDAVRKYGAVYTPMFYDPDNQYYNPTHHSYYNPSIEEGNHAVAIVGWQDKFDRNKFVEIPPGDGAFIVRNSWGSDWGEDGYFYVSYHDPYFARSGLNAAAKKPQATTNFTELYEYDPSGYITSLGFPPSTKAWFANIYKARSDTNLRAASFYAFGKTSRYKIFIYTNVDANQPRSGILACKKSDKVRNPGYYTIRFNKVPIKQGESFSVVVRLDTAGWPYPISIEKPVKKYTKNLKAKKGQSFVSDDGENWDDLPTFKDYKKTSVCLKAFAK